MALWHLVNQRWIKLSSTDQTYLQRLQQILERGTPSNDRTGNGTLSLFSTQDRYSFEEGFPLLTTKKVPWKGVVTELFWFLTGSTNIKYLVENGVKIWNGDAYRWFRDMVWPASCPGLAVPDEETFISGVLSGEVLSMPHGAWYVYGDLGPVYGAQWRGLVPGPQGPLPQLDRVIEELVANPSSRRLVVSAWDPKVMWDSSQVALPCCHHMFQFYSRDGVLSLHFSMRSNDYFLGAPFNIASYGLLLLMVANLVGMKPGELVHEAVDCHLYNGHLDAVREQLDRDPNKYNPPQVLVEDPTGALSGISGYTPKDIKLVGYESYPALKAPLFVG